MSPQNGRSSTADQGGRPVNATRDLLRRLATHDDRCLQVALSPNSRLQVAGTESSAALDRRTRTLVQLAALVAADAATNSLRWAADCAAATGADDQTVLQVLQTAGRAAGSVQTVSSTQRLALALDVDTGVTDDLAEEAGIERLRDRLRLRRDAALPVQVGSLGRDRVGRGLHLASDLPGC